jgi:hypothetical protein
MKPRRITIRIAEREYPIEISSPKEEEIQRKAADEINRRLDIRQKMNIKGKDLVDHLSLTALDLGVKFFSAQERLESSREEGRQLHRDIESYLENIDK